MRSLRLKIFLAGLACLLTLLACGTTTTVTPTVPAATLPPATDTPVPPTATVPALPVVSSPSISSLDMLDVNNGWAMSDSAVLRTTDGGTTWYNATPSGLSGAPVESSFLDAATAWVGVAGADPTTGTLYHTADGGVTWTSVAVPFGGGSIHFVDATHGWELVGLNAGMSHEAVAIFRSSDGGATWSQVFVDDPTVAGSSDTLPLVGDKNGITALDANNGWVTGAQPSTDFVYVYTSKDGGTTWAQQNVSIPAAYSGAMTSADLPVFFGASDAVLPVLLIADTNGAEFYVSHDGGQTWTATTPVAQGGFMAVASASDFFVWDGNAPLNVSHDGGSSWSAVTPNISIKDNMVSFQFVNATTGWALTDDASSHRMLYETTDGGATWNVLVP
ncbi:MAG TPA: hypothetical protein VMC09_14855 [Anaerolineales bacterium]|nr:hypothetical protein [Anaerolineales bacterium]